MNSHSRFFSFVMVITLACGNGAHAAPDGSVLTPAQAQAKTQRFKKRMSAALDVISKTQYLHATVCTTGLAAVLFGITKDVNYLYKGQLSLNETEYAWKMAKALARVSGEAALYATLGLYAAQASKDLAENDQNGKRKERKPFLLERMIIKAIDFAWNDTTFGEHWALWTPLYAIAAHSVWCSTITAKNVFDATRKIIAYAPATAAVQGA